MHRVPSFTSAAASAGDFVTITKAPGGTQAVSPALGTDSFDQFPGSL
jgi:hypothetical protein